MKLNRKGFTLIEIIVSIAIGSIVLFIAGSIILSSSNFLMTTTEMDIDKRCTDSIVDFVRGEIIYATDVRLMEYNSDKVPEINGEDDWHCFYVKDKVLYRDDSKVFSAGFYSSKELKLSAKGNYQNGSRIDLYYELWNSVEKTYSTRDTVMLLNVQVTDEIKNEGLFTQTQKELSNSSYALFYKKSLNTQIEAEDDDDDDEDDDEDDVVSYQRTGTVADQLALMTLAENRWAFKNDTVYRLGDMVYYNDKWWMWNTNSGQTTPGSASSHWKCLQAEWEQNSRYSDGDIVIYQGVYYQRKTGTGGSGWNQNPSLNQISQWNPNQHWNKVSKDVVEEKTYTIPKKTNSYTQDKKTVIHKIMDLTGYNDNPANIDKYHAFLAAIPDESQKSWTKYSALGTSMPSQPSDFYKIKDENAPGEYYHYYYRVLNTSHKAPGVKLQAGEIYDWQEISLEYVNLSAYIKNDVIYTHVNSSEIYYRALEHICNDDTLKIIQDKINKAGQTYDRSLLYSECLNPRGWRYRDLLEGMIWEKLGS